MLGEAERSESSDTLGGPGEHSAAVSGDRGFPASSRDWEESHGAKEDASGPKVECGQSAASVPEILRESGASISQESDPTWVRPRTRRESVCTRPPLPRN